MQFPLYLRQKLIYFNLRKDNKTTSFRDIRKALSLGINREEIITTILGTGLESFGPIPQNSWAYAGKIERYLYNECYFEDHIANEMFDDLVNGNDFSYFLETADLTPQELEYLKEEYGIEDEETTEA